MIAQTAKNLKHILSTIKSSFLPAVILAIGLMFYHAQQPYTPQSDISLHSAFFVFSAIGLLLLFFANRSKPTFTFIIGITTYILINWFKAQNGYEFINNPLYLWLCFMLPLNLALFYFLPAQKLFTYRNRWLFLFVLMQMSLIQHFGNIISHLPYIEIMFGCIPLLSALLWLIVLTPLLLQLSYNHTICDTGLFYANICLFIGLIYADSSSALTTFFLSFSLILCVTTFWDLYSSYNYDVLDNVGSYNSYVSHANSKFPYKYTIGLFSIDNRDKLLKVIGAKKMRELEQLLVDRIHQFQYDITIYRYVMNDELIMVFKNEDAKHTLEFAENIRHTIAASEFILTGNKSLKITISISVSEKTRLDLDATSVTTRAHNSLQKVYRFNCNVVTLATNS